MRSAVIDTETNEVVNIIIYTDRMGIHLPLKYIVYDCTQYDVQIGDTFEDGVFYRNGEPVEYQPSDTERLVQLEAAMMALIGEE